MFQVLGCFVQKTLNLKKWLLEVEVLLLMLGMCGKEASMERQNSNGLIKNFKRECQSENVSKALRITFCG
jgi:hypothetical protein